MHKLIIRSQGNLIHEFELAEGQEYIGGRADSCQIKLDGDQRISRQHFKIFFDGTNWKVELLSKIGYIIYKGESKSSFNLEKEDQFIISPYDFQLIAEEPAVVQKSTMLPAVAENNPLNVQSATSSIDPSNDFEEKTMIFSTPSSAYLRKLDATGEVIDSLKLDGSSWVAGRESTSQIVIADPKISRKQFLLQRANDQFYILDLESVNGTLVNGKLISAADPTPLKSGDVISVLENSYIFEMVDPKFEEKVKHSHLALQQIEMAQPQVQNHLIPAMQNEYQNQVQPYQQGYQNFYPAAHQPHVPGQWTPPENQYLTIAGKKIELNNNNKMRIGIVILLLIGVAYSTLDDQTPQKTAVHSNSTNPFDKLTQQEKALIQHTYELAKNLYTQGNYELAGAELAKIHQKLPKYEDSREMENYIKIAREIKEQSEAESELQRKKAEMEVAINKTIQECRKLLNNPEITSDQMEDCLQPAVVINPDNEAIIQLKLEVTKIEEDRKALAAAQAEYAERVAQLKGLFRKADEISKTDPLKGIKALDGVVQSSLPDPTNLKMKASRMIASIQEAVKTQINSAISTSRKLTESGNLKMAVITLEKAIALDPKNESLINEARKTRNDLQKKMQVIYQEAIVEENIGNLETAKDRFRKIRDQDVTDGEYYLKATMKLRKYEKF